MNEVALASGVALESTGGRVRIVGECTISSAAELWLLLQNDVLVSGAPLSLDLAEITELDTAGLQILLMVQRHLAGAGRTFEVVATNALVEQTLRLCGLSKWLVGAQAGRTAP